MWPPGRRGQLGWSRWKIIINIVIVMIKIMVVNIIIIVVKVGDLSSIPLGKISDVASNVSIAYKEDIWQNDMIYKDQVQKSIKIDQKNYHFFRTTAPSGSSVS